MDWDMRQEFGNEVTGDLGKSSPLWSDEYTSQNRMS